MKYRKLGHTNIDVSVICLGTMTWGEQNTEAEGHQQIDYALDQGVNFLDTAEMYAIPPTETTYGKTETIIGNWLKKTKRRDDIVLATKVTGPSAERFGWLRPELNSGQGPDHNRKNIEMAIEGSLRRLQTDYVDLYQLHWPSRNAPNFGEYMYQHQEEDTAVSIHESLEVLSDLVKAGKVRTIGLSNETPWGTMEFLKLAAMHNLESVVSIQNPYSLLCRAYDVGMSEVSCRANVGLLAYSPLAMGVLSGKFINDQWPEGARLTKWRFFGRYLTPRARAATEKYINLAKSHDLDPSQMALAYVNDRPFVTANIIGATTMEQLKINIDSINLTLDETVLKAIEEIHLEDALVCG